MNPKYAFLFKPIHLMLVTIILLSYTGLAEASALASPSTPNAEGDIWRTYTNANWVNDVAHEIVADGMRLWAATDGGLVRWYRDPVDYRKFLTADGLPSSQVNAIAIDGSGIKWIGTAKGLVRYDDDIFLTYSTANSELVNNAVNDIAIEGNGDIWIATSGGVSRLSGTTWTNYTTSTSGLASNSVVSLAIDGSVKWFGTSGAGISRFDGVNWTTYTRGSGPSMNSINAIAVDLNGVKWFGTGNSLGSSGGGGGGLYSFDNTTWITYTETTSDLASNYVFALTVDNSGAMWIGTEHGLNRYDGVTWSTYTQIDGLACDWVSALTQAGNEIWAGTEGGGISRRNVDFYTYRTRDQLPHNSLSALSAQGNNLWVSGADPFVISEYSGLSKYDGYAWTHYRYGKSGITMPEVYDVEAEPGGPLWVAGWDINTFDGTNWTLVTDPYTNPTYGAKVTLVAIDGSVKWFYSYEPFSPQQRKWVSRYNGVSWTAYTSSEVGLSLNTVRMLAVDQSHNLWLSTNVGVARFDGISWTTYTTASGLASNNVYDIEIDRDGSLWFTTNGGGVSHLLGSTWTTYNMSNSDLANNTVYAAAIDRYGRKWFATNTGVSVYDGASWTTYDKFNSGLADNAVSNVVITGDDHKWFYTASGLSELYRRPNLTLNYSSGAPGSYFNVVGSDFPPQTGTSLTVNGQGMGAVTTNASGVFTATITTSAAGEGLYFLTARLGIPGRALAPLGGDDLQATALFFLEAGGSQIPKEGDYPEYSVPAGSAVSELRFLPILTK